MSIPSQGRRILGQRFIRFLLVGALNTVFGYGVFYTLLLVGLPPEPALLVSTVAGVLFNFLTTSRLVFQNADPKLLRSFAAVYAVIFLVNAGALRLAIIAGIPAAWAQAGLLPVVIVVTYLAMRRFVYLGRKA